MPSIQNPPQNRREYLLARLEEAMSEGLSPTHSRQTIAVQIGGVRVDLVTPSQPLARRIREYFSAYSGSGPAQAEIELAELTADSTRPVSLWPRPIAKLPAPLWPTPLCPTSLCPTSLWPTSLWEDDDPEFDVRGDSVVQRDFAAQRRHSPFARAIAWVAPDLDDALHNLLRWFLPPLLLKNSTFLLHGAGVVREGKGYVFFGPSEAGKSTSVSLISEADPRATLLGDDGILIQMRGETPFLLSAPLGCGYSRNAPPPLAAPLQGLFALAQDSQHRIHPLSLSQGVSKLLASAMNVDFSEEIDHKFALALRFAQARCGIQELRFKKDPGFWPLVLRH